MGRQLRKKLVDDLDVRAYVDRLPGEQRVAHDEELPRAMSS